MTDPGRPSPGPPDRSLRLSPRPAHGSGLVRVHFSGPEHAGSSHGAGGTCHFIYGPKRQQTTRPALYDKCLMLELLLALSTWEHATTRPMSAIAAALGRRSDFARTFKADFNELRARVSCHRLSLANILRAVGWRPSLPWKAGRRTVALGVEVQSTFRAEQTRSWQLGCSPRIEWDREGLRSVSRTHRH